MTGWLEIVVIAFGAQLAVLPGEKVQFIIAGLSTRYRPWIVVSAAGLAFAGWTAVEIAVGKALQEALSPTLLDAFTGTLFLVFGILMIRSMGQLDEATHAQTDGGTAVAEDTLDFEILGFQVPRQYGSFLPIFALMAAGEFGDKTQVVTIGLAARFGAHPGIWVGEMLAIIPVSLVNAYFFNHFSDRFDPRKAHIAGAGLFFFFGFDTFLALATDFSIWETVVATVTDILSGLF